MRQCTDGVTMRQQSNLRIANSQDGHYSERKTFTDVPFQQCGNGSTDSGRMDLSIPAGCASCGTLYGTCAYLQKHPRYRVGQLRRHMHCTLQAGLTSDICRSMFLENAGAERGNEGTQRPRRLYLRCR